MVATVAGQLAGIGVQRGVAEMTTELTMRVTRQRGWRAWGTIDFVDLLFFVASTSFSGAVAGVPSI